MSPLLDLFVFYLRSIPFFISTETNRSSSVSIPYSVSIYQVPHGNITFGENIAFFCNLSEPIEDAIIRRDTIFFEWELHLTNSRIAFLPKNSDRPGEIGIIFNKTDTARAISCKATSASTPSESKISETIHPLIFSNDTNISKSILNSVYWNTLPLPSPRNLTTSYIEGRSVVISWMAPAVDSSLSKVLEYIVEYKKTVSDWTNGIEKLTLPVTEHSAHVKNLMPWTTYHFRVLALYLTGQSAPSYPVVILTPEERPSGAPQSVKVKVVNYNTLQILWTPAPKNTWNGAILGYNIGSRKASSSEGESYTFHVLTSMELLGKSCVHEISISDSSIPYKVVVQAFNNVGSGPLSIEAITEPGESHQQ